jgi:hypothetical protein
MTVRFSLHSALIGATEIYRKVHAITRGIVVSGVLLDCFSEQKHVSPSLAVRDIYFST